MLGVASGLKILYDLGVIRLPVKTRLPKIGRIGKKSSYSLTARNIFQRLTISSIGGEAIDPEICVPNIERYSRLVRDARDQIERRPNGRGQVPEGLEIRKVMKT